MKKLLILRFINILINIFTCIEIRVYEGNDLIAISIIPTFHILKSNNEWYRLINQYQRQPKQIAKLVIKKWLKFLPLSQQKNIEKQAHQHTVNDETWSDDDDTNDDDQAVGLLKLNNNPTNDEEDTLDTQDYANRITKQIAKRSRTFDKNGDPDYHAEQMHEIKIDIQSGFEDYQIKKEPDQKKRLVKEPQRLLKQPHQQQQQQQQQQQVIDFEKEEDFEEEKEEEIEKKNFEKKNQKKKKFKKKKKFQKKNAQHFIEKTSFHEHPYFRHWRIQMPYDKLPMIQNPFQEFDLYPARCSFLDNLVIPSTEVIGTIRANFRALQITSTTTDHKMNKPIKLSFDHQLYKKKDIAYCIRIYLGQGKQFMVTNPKHANIHLELSVGHYDFRLIYPKSEEAILQQKKWIAKSSSKRSSYLQFNENMENNESNKKKKSSLKKKKIH